MSDKSSAEQRDNDKQGYFAADQPVSSLVYLNRKKRVWKRVNRVTVVDKKVDIPHHARHFDCTPERIEEGNPDLAQAQQRLDRVVDELNEINDEEETVTRELEEAEARSSLQSSSPKECQKSVATVYKLSYEQKESDEFQAQRDKAQRRLRELEWIQAEQRREAARLNEELTAIQRRQVERGGSQ